MKKMIAITLSTLTAAAVLIPTVSSLAAETSKEKAEEIALNHAGINSDQVAYIRSHMDYDDGKKVYDVEFHTKDYKEYDYEIEVSTGSILSYDYDAEYYDTSRQPKSADSSQDNSVTADDAKGIALTRAGLQMSDVTFRSIHQDYDDGRLVYEGFFLSGTTEYEFEIDADSGNILEWDQESIFD